MNCRIADEWKRLAKSIKEGKGEMKKIICRSIILFVSGISIIFILDSCVNVSEKIAINEDYSGTISIELRQDAQTIQEQFSAMGFDFGASPPTGQKNQPLLLKDYLAKSNDVFTMYFLERLAYAKAYEVGDLRQALRKAVREKTNGEVELVSLNKREIPFERKKDDGKKDDEKSIKSRDITGKTKDLDESCSYTSIKLKFKDVNKLKSFSEELFNISVSDENGILEYKHDIQKILVYYYNRMRQASSAKTAANAGAYSEPPFDIKGARLFNLEFRFELELPYPIIESNAPWEEEGKTAMFVFPVADLLEGKVRVFSLWAKAKKQ